MAINAPRKAVILARRYRFSIATLDGSAAEAPGRGARHADPPQCPATLAAVGVEEVTIVVGYRKDAIKYACDRRFGPIEINYVDSSAFDRTGSAYSLWLARDTLLSGDCYHHEAITVLDDKSTAGKGIADVVAAQLLRSGEHAIRNSYVAGEKDYAALVSRMKKDGVWVAYIGGYHTEVGLIVRQASMRTGQIAIPNTSQMRVVEARS